MTNVFKVTTLYDAQSGAPVKVELGKTGDDEFSFRFGDALFPFTLTGSRTLQRVLESIARRIDKACRKQIDCKPGRKKLGELEIGVDADSGWFIRAGQGRFVYLDVQALVWLVIAVKQSLAPPVSQLSYGYDALLIFPHEHISCPNPRCTRHARPNSS